jgi:hypothetical protein
MFATVKMGTDRKLFERGSYPDKFQKVQYSSFLVKRPCLYDIYFLLGILLKIKHDFDELVDGITATGVVTYTLEIYFVLTGVH